MASGDENDGFKLDEHDRLPWLEPAGVQEPEPEKVSPQRLMLLGGLVVLLIALVSGGVMLFRSGDTGGSNDGDVQLVAAESENYKVAANASDAKSFDGEGDEAFEASEGREATGRIDASRVAEQPRADLQPAAVETPDVAASKPVEKPVAKPVVSAAVQPVAKPAREAALSAAVGATTSGARIQLGALGSKAIAEEVWKKHSARFDYLASLSHSVEPVVTGGKTLFRLRAGVSSVAEATEICGKLRVAGENCMVVR